MGNGQQVADARTRSSRKHEKTENTMGRSLNRYIIIIIILCNSAVGGVVVKSHLAPSAAYRLIIVIIFIQIRISIGTSAARIKSFFPLPYRISLAR